VTPPIESEPEPSNRNPNRVESKPEPCNVFPPPIPGAKHPGLGLSRLSIQDSKPAADIELRGKVTKNLAALLHNVKAPKYNVVLWY